jgi:hypothetical protein
MNNSHDHAPTGPARVVLAERTNAGLQVTLLWAEDTNAVAILVRDDGSDDQFEVSVEADDACLRLRAPLCVRRLAWRRLPACQPQNAA